MNPEKLDPNLQFQMQMPSYSLLDGLKVIVRHRGDSFFNNRALGDVQSFNLISAQAMSLQTNDIEELSDEDDIEYIWADLPVQACLDSSVPSINVPQLWDRGFLGDGIKLAVIDSGIDPKHPDFAGRIIARQNFIGGSEDDENGHGTHVASAAAGDGKASNGKYRGVAPAAHLYIAKVLNAAGDGSMSSVMAGIEWAVEQGVQVINLSLGSGVSCNGSDALSMLCDAAVEQRGIMVCVAAGNSGPNAQTVGSPGCAKLVMTVGASTDDNQVASFSSRGPTADGRIKPDVLFPGVAVIAAQAAGTELGDVVMPGYVSMQGTSMATPHAAGACCLLLQAKPDLSPQKIKTIFQNTATDIRQPVNAQGSGRADVLKALGQLDNIPEPDPTPPTPTPDIEPEPEKKGCLGALLGG